MKKDVFIGNFVFLFVILLLFVGCSSNEDFESQDRSLVETRIISNETPFSKAVSEAVERSQAEVMYLLYNFESEEYIICDELTYALGDAFNVFLSQNSSNSEVNANISVNNVKQGKSKPWIFAGNVTDKWGAIKLAYKLAKMLPADCIVEIRIVPKKDGSKDVFYRIV